MLFYLFKVLVMEKKEIWKIVLTVIKYAVTLALGYLGGTSGII